MQKTLTLAMTALALAGCGSQPGLTGQAYGSARLMLEASEGRSVQYLASDIQAARVTVLGSVSGGAYSQVTTTTFTGTNLASHLSDSTLSFTVDNLKVGDSVTTYTYQAKVETYLETGMTTLLGSSTSSGFSVTAAQAPATVPMPALKLLASPIGSASAGVTIVDTPTPAVVIR